MKNFSKLRSWWNITGKSYVFTALLIYLVIIPFIKQFPVVAKYLPDDKFAIPMIAVCLYLMMQIFMTLIKGEGGEYSLEKLDGSTGYFKERIKTAKSLDIVCLSSESLFAVLKEPISTQKIKCRILLSHPYNKLDEQKVGISHYSSRYKDLAKANPACAMQVRFCYNTFSRIVIIDDNEVFFGFYKLENSKLKGHSLDMFHAKYGSQNGNFIMGIAKNRFESLWESGDEEVLLRERQIS